MAVITDDFMREMRVRARSHSLVILRRAARYNEPEETDRIMDGDPAVRASVLSYVVHPVRGFSGESLPPCQGGGR